MKLISLYINNFGKLSDFSFNFSDKMNSIYEENGWGKTTLTVFIKSMLYGLNKNERAHYTPWNTTTSFGGWLVLESHGKNYKIERKFSPQKASADEIKLYDLATNMEFNNVDSNLGEKLLNLNETSFERSVFIPQKDLEQGFGSDIEAKLANLIGGTDDTQTFDQAIDILKAKSHELRLNSKKGLINDKKMELAQIDDEIEECNNRMMGLPVLHTTIDKINSDINELINEKKKYNSQIINLTKTQDRRVKREVVAKYEQDIRLAKISLEKNNEVFNGHDVSIQEVLAYRAKNKELQTLKTQYEVKQQNNRASQKVEKLEKEVNLTELPDDEKLEEITESILKLNNIKSVIAANKQQKVEKIKPKAGIAFTVIASILLVIGAGLALTGAFINIAPLLYAGMGVAILAVLLYVGALAAFVINNQKNAANQVGGQVAAYDYEKNHLEEEIREFFSKYHIYSSDFTSNLFKIRTAVQRYKDAKDEATDIALENKALENKINEYETAINTFLAQFKSSSSCVTNEEKIGELNTHLRNRGEIESMIQEKERICKSFISDNNLDKQDADGSISADELNHKIEEIDAKIEALNKAKSTYVNKLSDYENEIAMYDDYIEKKEEVEAQIRELEDQLRLINLSMEYLSASQTSLLGKYVSPMKDSVNKYVSLLLKDQSDYSIDVNFKFQFVTNDGLKSIDSYSRGYQTIISLCMRLALIDCLYPDEKPFIILDDPFVNFDDEKLDLCKALIRAISTSYQIMYFACHKSRAITTQRTQAQQQPVQREVQKPVTLNPIPSNANVRVSQTPISRPTVVPQAPKPAPQPVKPKLQTSEDAVERELSRAQAPKVAPRTVTDDDGALGPMMSRGQSLGGSDAPKPARTFTIKKK